MGLDVASQRERFRLKWSGLDFTDEDADTPPVPAEVVGEWTSSGGWYYCDYQVVRLREDDLWSAERNDWDFGTPGAMPAEVIGTFLTREEAMAVCEVAAGRDICSRCGARMLDIQDGTVAPCSSCLDEDS